MSDLRELIIIGSGPAGCTAGIYAGRANLKPLLIAGPRPGGQLTITTTVENFPGFPAGIDGPALMQLLQEQAACYGTEIRSGEVREVDFAVWPFRVWTAGEALAAKAVIIATGAQAIWLGVPGEERLRGRGVSACATCDGFLFADEDVAVIGGGDTALEEATYLAGLARSVTVIHRRGELRASAALRERAFANDKIRFRWHTVVSEILGDEMVEGLRLRDVASGAESVAPFAGVFVAIGHLPNTRIFRGQVGLDEKGYVRAPDPGGTATSVPGVFAAGDVRDPVYRQAVVAAGDGCKAALDARRWLEAKAQP